MKRNTLVSLIISGLLIAIGLILPFFLGQVQVLAQGISPMHIPAFIAGLTCGPLFGAAVGFITPLLRFMMFGMPALPVAVPMAFELAAYGILTGCLYPLFNKKFSMPRYVAILVSMLIAMVLGRLIGGAAKAVFMGVTNADYSFSMFVSAYFLGTWVGAILHLLICPAVVTALEKAHLSPLRQKMNGSRE